MTAKLEKPARIATSSEIREREKAIIEFMEWAGWVKKGRGRIVVPPSRRAHIIEAAAEIGRLTAAIDIAVDALGGCRDEFGHCRDALAEIKRIKEAA